jgi:hypothetical protein
MRTLSRAAFFGILLAAAGTSYGQSQTFSVVLRGSEEVTPQGGDPDGFGSGTVTLNATTNTATWNIVYGNLDPVSDAHIHIGALGVGGGVVIPFGTQNTAGTPNTISGSVVDPDVTAVFNNPTNYYVNIHTSAFLAGAIRGQVLVPEPASMALVGIAGLAMLRRRRVAT